MELSFWQAQFPKIIGGKDTRVQLPDEFRPRCISYLLLVMGGAEISGCMSSSAHGRQRFAWQAL
jgi:hypothetical protein